MFKGVESNSEIISELRDGAVIADSYPLKATGAETPKELIHRSKLRLGLTTVCTTAQEVQQLLQHVDLSGAGVIHDPWAGTCMIEAVLASQGLAIRSNDAHAASPADQHSNALEWGVYRDWQTSTGLGAVVCSPHFALLDLAVPLAAEMVSSVACFHVPGHYYTSAPPPRWEYLQQLQDAGRLHLVFNLPFGPLGRRCMWICIFRSRAIRDRMVLRAPDG